MQTDDLDKKNENHAIVRRVEDTWLIKMCDWLKGRYLYLGFDRFYFVLRHHETIAKIIIHMYI